jgi:hypothetical protein
MLQGLVCRDLPLQGFPKVPFTHINYLVAVPPPQATEH